MSKTEFIKIMNDRLSLLNDSERNDIINEFSLHIDDQMASGKSEEEAVSTLGDIDEIIHDILDVYHLNTNNTNTKNNQNFEFYANNIKTYFEKVWNNLKEFSMNDVIYLIFKFILLLVFIAIISKIFKGVIFMLLPFGPFNLFLSLLVELLLFILALYLIYIFINKEILENKVSSVKMQKVINKHTNKTDSDSVFWNIFKVLIVIFVMIPMIFAVVGTGVGFLFSVIGSIYFNHLLFWGISVVLLGCLIFGAALVTLIGKIIGGKK
ncbi:MAG: DUF1700 domain-containing protein [Erysipelotrichaceae bacterium]